MGIIRSVQIRYKWARLNSRVWDFWWYWCCNFPQRVWLHRQWLAHDQDFDWCSLAGIMQVKLERMARTFENGHHVNCAQDAKECRIAAHLLRRLCEDNYTVVQFINRVPAHDQKLLGKLIGRKMRYWWD